MKEMMDIRKGFTIGFDFRMAPRGADGMAFVIHRCESKEEEEEKEREKENRY